MNKKQQYHQPEIEIASMGEITCVLAGSGMIGPADAPYSNVDFEENDENDEKGNLKSIFGD